MGVDKDGKRDKLEGRKKPENSYSSTRPLHAMLDEPADYRDCVLIIVLNYQALLSDGGSIPDTTRMCSQRRRWKKL